MQTDKQVAGKRKIADAEKANFDAMTGLGKFLDGKARNGAGGKMYRVTSGASHIGNIWGHSVKDVFEYVIKNTNLRNITVKPLV